MATKTAETGFFTVITGQVESGQVEGVDQLAVHYTLRCGADWTFKHGVQTGVSQIAIRSAGPNPGFVWNYPIEATYHSTNVHGWPQLVVSVYGLNWHGKDIIKGYGCTFLPTTPGRQTRYIRLYAPFSSSKFQQCCAWLTSNPPEFFEPLFLAQGKGRQVVRVQSSGVIKITVNVATKNMEDWGYRSWDNETAAPSDPPYGSVLRQAPSYKPSRRGEPVDDARQDDAAPQRAAVSRSVSRSKNHKSKSTSRSNLKSTSRSNLRRRGDPQSKKNPAHENGPLGLNKKSSPVKGGRRASPSPDLRRGPSRVDEARSLLADMGH